MATLDSTFAFKSAISRKYGEYIVLAGQVVNKLGFYNEIRVNDFVI